MKANDSSNVSIPTIGDLINLNSPFEFRINDNKKELVPHVLYYGTEILFKKDYVIIERPLNTEEINADNFCVSFAFDRLHYTLIDSDNELHGTILFDSLGIKNISLDKMAEDKQEILSMLQGTMKNKLLNSARIHTHQYSILYKFLDPKDPSTEINGTYIFHTSFESRQCLEVLKKLNDEQKLTLNHFFQANEQRKKLLGLLTPISDYTDAYVIQKLHAYFKALDTYQLSLERYKNDKSEENRKELVKTVVDLRIIANDLHNSLMSKPTRISSQCMAFLGATIGLILAPVAIAAGLITTLALALSIAALSMLCGPCIGDCNAGASSRSNENTGFVFYIAAFALFPYYTVLSGAKIGRDLAEKGFFKAPKQIDNFQKTCMAHVNREIYDERTLKQAEPSWFNNGDFNFYQF